MAAQNASLGTPGHPTKDVPTRRGRRVREDPQDDERTATQSNPPNHGLPTHGPTRFLWEVPAGTPLEELSDLWERWNDETMQGDLEEWSK